MQCLFKEQNKTRFGPFQISDKLIKYYVNQDVNCIEKSLNLKALNFEKNGLILSIFDEIHPELLSVLFNGNLCLFRD